MNSRDLIEKYHNAWTAGDFATARACLADDLDFQGSIDTFRQIFDKKLDPIRALVSGKLKLKGNLGKIMRSVKATLDLVNAASTVPTLYPEGS